MKILTTKFIPRDFYKPLLMLAVLGGGVSYATVNAAEMQMNADANKAMTMTATKSASMSKSSMSKNSSMQGGDAPKDARSPDYSDGYKYRGMGGWEQTDEITFSKVMIDQLEYRNNDGNNTLRWDMQGWRGTDYKKLWFKFEGEKETSTSTYDLELQTLYSRAVAAFWDFQMGARYDRSNDAGVTNDRFFAVIGFQGLAPYWFEVEPALFVSDNGDVSARIVSTYDLLFTQRLILQPRFEMNIAASEVAKFGVGKGINDIQFGLRLRYEIRREIAPYIGVSWSKLYGDTRTLARADGKSVDNLAIVAGIRLWF